MPNRVWFSRNPLPNTNYILFLFRQEYEKEIPMRSQSSPENLLCEILRCSSVLLAAKREDRASAGAELPDLSRFNRK